MFSLIKRFLPKSLLGRTVMILVLPMVLVQGASVYIFYQNHWDALSRRLAMTLASDIMTIVNLHQQSDMSDETLQALLMRTQDIQLTYIDGDVPYARVPIRKRYVTLLAHEVQVRGGEGFTIMAHPSEGDSKFQILYPLADGRTLLFDVPLKRVYSLTPYVFMLWTLGLSLIFLAIAVIFMRNQMRPVQRLAAAAAAFGKGRPMRRYRPSGATEVRQAGEAFLHMQDSISRHIQQRTTMLAGVSHDLRTPLTRMELQLAMLKRQMPAEAWQSLHDDVKEMEALINSYLIFAKGDADEKPQPIRLADIFAEACKGVPADAVTLHISNVSVHLRKISVQRALQNIIQNGIKYGERVFIYSDIEPNRLTLHIEDAGQGIPEEEFEAVFRPFYRREASRNSSTGGVGLGLAIARDIARAQGGDVTLSRSEKHGGLRVSFHVAL